MFLELRNADRVVNAIALAKYRWLRRVIRDTIALFVLCRTTSMLAGSVRLRVRRATRFRDVRVNVLGNMEGGNRLRDVINKVTRNRTSAVSHCQTFICHSMTTLYRLLIGDVPRDGMVTSFHVLCVSTDNDLIRVSLGSVTVRPTIRRRAALRVRFVSRLRRTGVKAIRHFLRNHRNVNVVYRASCHRTGAVIERALICFWFASR